MSIVSHTNRPSNFKNTNVIGDENLSSPENDNKKEDNSKHQKTYISFVVVVCYVNLSPL